MAPRKSGRTNDRTKRTTREESAPNTNRNRNAFITPGDINAVGTTKVKLLGPVRVWSFRSGSSSVIAEVQIGGTKGPIRDLSMPIGKPSHISVEKLLGKDVTKWGGHVIEVYPNGKWVNVASEDDQNVPTSDRARNVPDEDNIPF